MLFAWAKLGHPSGVNVLKQNFFEGYLVALNTTYIKSLKDSSYSFFIDFGISVFLRLCPLP